MDDTNDAAKRSHTLWNEIAADWDARMGEGDNQYYRKIIRPATLRLLSPKPGERILDAACGTGNFSRLLAGMGASVTAFDFSEELIAHARERGALENADVDFRVADATDYDGLMRLSQNGFFDKAVSNMAVMDISDVEPLFRAVHDMLREGGIFVFSGVHPCFQTPNMRKVTYVNDYTDGSVADGVQVGIQTFEYIRPKRHEVMALARNDKRVMHFHRPLGELLGICFKSGFVLDGIEEPVFERPERVQEFDWYEIPPSIILRLRK